MQGLRSGLCLAFTIAIVVLWTCSRFAAFAEKRGAAPVRPAPRDVPLSTRESPSRPEARPVPPRSPAPWPFKAVAVARVPTHAAQGACSVRLPGRSMTLLLVANFFGDFSALYALARGPAPVLLLRLPSKCAHACAFLRRGRAAGAAAPGGRLFVALANFCAKTSTVYELRVKERAVPHGDGLVVTATVALEIRSEASADVAFHSFAGQDLLCLADYPEGLVLVHRLAGLAPTAPAPPSPPRNGYPIVVASQTLRLWGVAVVRFCSATSADGRVHRLLVAGSYWHNGFDTVSAVFRFNEAQATYSLLQHIPTHGAHGVDCFDVDSRSYLALANVRNNTHFAVHSEIYVFGQQQYEPLQSVPTSGAHDVMHVWVRGHVYLFFGNRGPADECRGDFGSPVYRYDRSHGRFVAVGELPGACLTFLHPVCLDGQLCVVALSERNATGAYLLESEVWRLEGADC